VKKLALPTLLQEVRNHFNCPTADGADLENGGGGGTGQHNI
jgi:hypothetical protein